MRRKVECLASPVDILTFVNLGADIIARIGIGGLKDMLCRESKRY